MLKDRRKEKNKYLNLILKLVNILFAQNFIMLHMEKVKIGYLMQNMIFYMVYLRLKTSEGKQRFIGKQVENEQLKNKRIAAQSFIVEFINCTVLENPSDGELVLPYSFKKINLYNDYKQFIN